MTESRGSPDQRGYGRTTGWDDAYDGDLDSFRIPNLVRDVLGLVSALGYRSVAAVIGHDFGSPVAAFCAVIRPDVFRSVALLSVPFGGPPPLPFNAAEAAARSVTPSATSVLEDLAKLDRPRKYYQQYYRTREANHNMWRAPQGIHAFLRAYYHFKSADWKQNQPFKLAAFTAGELAKMPTYYVMDFDRGMAETVLLSEGDFEPWLSGTAGIELLAPAPDDALQRWPVSNRVNSSKAPADDPTLIDRIDLSAAQQLAGRRSDSTRD